MFLERLVQHVRPGKWGDLDAIDKKYNATESRYGFPAKRRYQALFSGSDSNTLIIEREWESMAKMEAAYMALMQDPEFKKLGDKMDDIVDSNIQEIYWSLP